jgi:metal-sulfur cluster biosynthetic enzyme
MATVEQMRQALREIYDPEIPINIVDLGLIYKIEESEPGKALIQFTLTNPMCPIGDQLAGRIREAVARLEGVTEVKVELVWEPPWSREKLTFEGKLQASMLGFG